MTVSKFTPITLQDRIKLRSISSEPITSELITAISKQIPISMRNTIIKSSTSVSFYSKKGAEISVIKKGNFLLASKTYTYNNKCDLLVSEIS